MCSNITINDDALIEGDEIFTLSLSTLSTNFSAGVVLSPENVTIEILDNDGKYRIYIHYNSYRKHENLLLEAKKVHVLVLQRTLLVTVYMMLYHSIVTVRFINTTIL